VVFYPLVVTSLKFIFLAVEESFVGTALNILQYGMGIKLHNPLIAFGFKKKEQKSSLFGAEKTRTGTKYFIS
jgi:hypothetical protein